MDRPRRAPRFPLPLERVQGRAAAPARDLLRPQRPLQQAADDAARLKVPSGLGLDSESVRAGMVERLRAAGIGNEPVLQAFAQVPRHRFVDSALANQAYEDTSLPIGLAQTISKPSVVARMLSLLFAGAYAGRHGHLGRVLEIGGGCGYQAALLQRLARRVTSIERLKPLADKARANLAAIGARDVQVLHADGRLGYPARAPYDTIVAAAGGDDVPSAWIEQLAIGGRLVAPVAIAARGSQQMLTVIDRHAAGPLGLTREVLDAVHFVPLKSGTA